MNPELLDTTAAAQMFMDVMKAEYQGRQYLTGIGEDHDMVGTTLNIPILESVEMTDRGFTSGDLPITTIGRRNVTVTTHDKALKSTIGDAYATQFLPSLVMNESKAHILGAARQVDAIKLLAITSNTFNTANNNLVAKNTETGTRTGLTVNQIIDGQTKLEANGYNMGSKLFMVGNAPAVRQLFYDDKFTDWDYRPERPIGESPVNQFDELLGMSVRKLGGSGPNTIATSGASQETAVYLISGDALVNGYNSHLSSAVVPEPAERRTSIVSGFVMGSAVVHPKGIIKIVCDQISTVNT